jgi:hypothetical protein
MAAVAGAQPLGGPPPPTDLTFTRLAPPIRKCSRRTCAHMLEYPIDMKADGSDYYNQCWRCRDSRKLTASKRRKLNATTTTVVNRQVKSLLIRILDHFLTRVLGHGCLCGLLPLLTRA